VSLWKRGNVNRRLNKLEMTNAPRPSRGQNLNAIYGKHVRPAPSSGVSGSVKSWSTSLVLRRLPVGIEPLHTNLNEEYVSPISDPHGLHLALPTPLSREAVVPRRAAVTAAATHVDTLAIRTSRPSNSASCLVQSLFGMV
jgi:hypothetical protein